MQKKVISISTNNNIIYKQILSILNFSLNLTSQERDILAEIIKLNNKYIVLPEEDRVKFIFCIESRKEMMEAVGLKQQRFYNLIGRLKQKTLSGKPLLDENNFLHPSLFFSLDNEGFQIEINLVNTKVEESIKEIKQNIEENQEEVKEEIKEEIKEYQPNFPQEPDVDKNKINEDEIVLNEPE